jgi:hypothetical protein
VIAFASKCFGLVDVNPRGPEGNSAVGRVWEGSRAVALAVHETSFCGFSVVGKLLCYAFHKLASSVVLVAESEILKVHKHFVVLKVTLSWDVKLYNLGDIESFRETFCLHL